MDVRVDAWQVARHHEKHEWQYYLSILKSFVCFKSRWR